MRGVLISCLLMAAALFSGGCVRNIAQGNGGAPAGIAIRPVADVIAENLKTWRFKPGEEVFVNESDEPTFAVSLACAPDGQTAMAWAEGGGRKRIVVAGSSDGEVWARTGEIDTQSDNTLSLGVAANAAGEVGVAWVEGGLFRWALRSASGRWSEPVDVGPPQPLNATNPQGSVAVTADPDGGFWLLALIGELGDSPTAYLWRRAPDGTWTAHPPPALQTHPPRAVLGWREGLVSMARQQLVRREPNGQWRDIGQPPWEPGPPEPARDVSLWSAPASPAAAVVGLPNLALSGAALMTGPDLTQWSEPAFLGWVSRAAATAVAASDRATFVATAWEPWGYSTARGVDPEATTWHSPRVFRIDDRLTRDTDDDGLTDVAEEWLLTDYQNPDTDGDGTLDGVDLDPLAATAPDTEKARILQAIVADRPRQSGLPEVVISDQRQAFTDHVSRILSLTKQEANLQRRKCGWAIPWFEVTRISVGLGRRTATAEWDSGGGDSKAGFGQAVSLEKRDGRWVVTASRMTRIS